MCWYSEFLTSLCPPDGLKVAFGSYLLPASDLKNEPNGFASIYSSPIAFDCNLPNVY
jgi:hypothetical protein